ncbi:MAG: hypothetical protein ACJ75B_01705 [Flavisolibacter sp.]
MKEFQATFDLYDKLSFFHFWEVVNSRERKFFVQAKLGSGPTESFEIKQKGSYAWAIMDPVPDWVLALHQKLFRVIADNS